MIGKISTILFILFILTGCQNEAPPFNSSKIGDTRSAEANFLALSHSRASRNGDALILKLGQGNRLFQDLDEDKCIEKIESENIPKEKARCPVTYKALAYLVKQGVYLLEVFMYEEERYFALLYDDGTLDFNFEDFAFAPGLKRFVTYQSGCGYYSDAVVAIGESRDGKFKYVHAAVFEEGNSLNINSAQWDGDMVTFDVADCSDNDIHSSMSLKKTKQGNWIWSGPKMPKEVEIK